MPRGTRPERSRRIGKRQRLVLRHAMNGLPAPSIREELRKAGISVSVETVHKDIRSIRKATGKEDVKRALSLPARRSASPRRSRKKRPPDRSATTRTNKRIAHRMGRVLEYRLMEMEPGEIRDALRGDHGIDVSLRTVKNDLRRLKDLAGGPLTKNRL